MASLARPTSSRAVHLRITPRPSSISDSREILRLVAQFGEVEYYKNLKYDALSHPSASLVIFREERAAQACLRRSPIRFRLGVDGEEERVDADAEQQKATAAPAGQTQTASRPQPPTSTSRSDSPKGPMNSPFGISQSRALSTSSLPTPPLRSIPNMPFLQPNRTHSNQNQTSSRIFQLQTNPAHHNFRDAIDRSEYHGRFALDIKSAIQNDLVKRVPAAGLSCWEWRRGEKPDRVVQALRMKDGEGEDGRRRKTLMEVWEEGRGVGW